MAKALKSRLALWWKRQGVDKTIGPMRRECRNIQMTARKDGNNLHSLIDYQWGFLLGINHGIY
jgi:hypothetical protein